jgi:hypothetical protein
MTTDIDFDAGRYAAFLMASLPGLAAAKVARGRLGCLDAALDAAPRAGLGVELGVYQGRSLRHAARRQPWRHFHGFDSLTGFPDDGRPDWRQDFSVAAAPELPVTCTFHEGYFEVTVPRFAAAATAPVGFLNIDCDIHASAHQGLTALAPLLGPGVAVHLDEGVNYDTWLFNEMLALFRFLDAERLDVRWIARGGRLRDLPETLRFLEAGRYPRWGDDLAAGYSRQAACVLVARAEDWPAAPAGMAERLAARAVAHHARSQVRVDCHPDDPFAPPPPPLPAWRRWLRWR